MHILLTGATGLVGSAVLHSMINTPTISKITLLSRRPVAQAEGQGKVEVIIHKDFSDYGSDVLEQLKDVHGVVWAQGISQTKVNKTEYKAITTEYPLSFARAISKTTSPKPINFVYISGEGATTTPSPLTLFFGVVKGATESQLLALSHTSEYSNLRPYSVRPGGVDESDHPEIHEYVGTKTMFEKILKGVALPVLKNVFNGSLTPTKELGKVATALAIGDGEVLEGKGIVDGGRTVTNTGLRRMAGL